MFYMALKCSGCPLGRPTIFIDSASFSVRCSCGIGSARWKLPDERERGSPLRGVKTFAELFLLYRYEFLLL